MNSSTDNSAMHIAKISDCSSTVRTMFTERAYGYAKPVIRISLFLFYRPGFIRLNMPFFFDAATIDFIMEAVDAIATHGWKLLPCVSYWSCIPTQHQSLVTLMFRNLE